MVSFIIIVIVFTIQVVEIPGLKRVFYNQHNLLSTAKISLFRCTLVGIVCAPSLFSFNEYYLIMLKGAVINSIFNLILPVAILLWRACNSQIFSYTIYFWPDLKRDKLKLVSVVAFFVFNSALGIAISYHLLTKNPYES